MDKDAFLITLEERLEYCCDRYFYKGSVVGKAARYSLLGAGKRARATLIFLTRQMCGKGPEDILSLACAVEMVHCYSLIHDDLPCMDDDDLRRGKPSCHIAYGEANALLAGDALIGCAVQTISDDEKLSCAAKLEAISALCDAMGPMGMIYGQELDLIYENIQANKEELRTIHRNKTGKMISLCGVLGSLDVNLSDKQKNALNTFFENIGLAFQIVDDILDVEGDRKDLGKPVGSDIESNKSTFVSLYGLRESKKIASELSSEAEDKIKEAFGERADRLCRYAGYLLKRNK